MKYFSLIICLAFACNISLSQPCYTLSPITYSPDPFGSGTSVSMLDDAIYGPVPLDFTFCYFGNLYTEFYIGSNGWLGFSGGQPTTYTTSPIPSTSASVPKNCIMGPWQDWHPGVAGGPYIFYQTLGTAPNRRLVVSWNDCPMYLCTSTKGTFQIKIFEGSDIIENHIRNKPNCLLWAFGTAVQGIHDLSGTIALTVPGRNSTQWTTTNEAYQYIPTCINCGNLPLPVEMLSFDAESNYNSVDLRWVTASELNNDHFLIERSANTEFYVPIAKVNGSGSTNQAMYYGYTDNSPLKGTSYYRLKQVDHDGKFEYSKTVAVELDYSEKLIITPIPVIDIMYVYFDAENNSPSYLQIINNRGHVVATNELYSRSSEFKFEIDVSSLLPGVYFVRLTDASGNHFSKIISKL